MFSTIIAVIAFIAASFLLVCAGMYRFSRGYRLDNAIAGMMGREVRVFLSWKFLIVLAVWVVAGVHLFG